ncbi:MAG: hypothetical protein HC921_17600 [Synechococcaceae cyanobacterium SM2_3_1]|nr:hypothetical protein [Synechococcaceae cyanobacterium SM2_3_1]
MTQTLFPSLLVRDMEQTVAWYQRNLGATVKMSVPSSTDPSCSRFVTLTLAGNDLMLEMETPESVETKYPQLGRPVEVGSTMAINIQVEDAEVTFEALADRDSIVAEPSDMFYGMREFTLKDPNGYLMTVASPLPQSPV